MDLENFDAIDAIDGELRQVSDIPRSFSTSAALHHLDREWYTNASRRARWMDLLGDYAGNEAFVIDGESLLQVVLDDNLLALGRPNEPSFQILHAIHSLERILSDFQRRSAVFEIVFFQENRHLTMCTGGPAFIVASRSLARCLLIRHLQQKLKGKGISVHNFTSLSDPAWLRYQTSKKPMFIMANDGGLPTSRGKQQDVAAILCQRLFLFELLANGIAVSLLRGAEFRDSKILSFVYESRFISDPRDSLPVGIWEAVSNARTSLDDKETVTRLDIAKNVPSWDISSSSTYDSSLTSIAQGYCTVTPNSSMAVPELLYFFIAHCVLLENVSIDERGASKFPGQESLDTNLVRTIVESFLPRIFFVIDSLISRDGGVGTIDVDGRLFVSLIHFAIANSSLPTQELVGPTVYGRTERIWSTTNLPPVNILRLAQRFPCPPSSSPSPPASLQQQRYSLLPFSNQVFDEELSSIRVQVSSTDEVVPPLTSAAHLEFGVHGTLFSDTQHWHNTKKSILPSHHGGKPDPKPANEWQRRKKLRSEQRFMSTLQQQAGTLTGALGAVLKQIVIPPVGSGSGMVGRQSKVKGVVKEKPGSKPQGKKGKFDPPLSSADKLRQKIAAEKQSSQDISSSTWWQTQLNRMEKMGNKEKITHLEALQRNKRGEEAGVGTEMRLYRLHIEFLRWMEEPELDSDVVRDRYTVSVMRTVKEILDRRNVTHTVSSILASVFIALGFSQYVDVVSTSGGDLPDRKLAFKFVKLIKSTTKAPLYKYMHIKEDPIVWQLRLFGEFMDRSMDSKPDHRVHFEPDGWQRQVLDAIDANESLLVVAPTSAGKTFISYYAMEKVLRTSDDGILVYVAPTKALVTQIAAEVYARFNKQLNGRSCWGVHTRDYRIHDPQKCQILVTVPEMLAIMLLSPPLAAVWTSRIRRIILDEIHSIGQQEGGAVWEQIILLAPCPIIGLSATVGAPEIFNNWLQSVQEAHGYKHSFISHPHRFSHLRKFTYALQLAPHEFCGLDVYQSTGRARFLHPIASLSFGVRSLPPDLALEASDTLSLYNAIVLCRDVISEDLSLLDPTVFFAKTGFLRQADVVRYEVALKEVLSHLIASHDNRDTSSPLRAIIQTLEDPIIRKIPQEVLNTAPTRMRFRTNLIHLVSDLHADGNLPAILFNFDRTDCEIMAMDLLSALLAAEEEWRENSPAWARKIRDWEDWKSRTKERERQADKAKKVKKDPDAPSGPTHEHAWESTFNPDDPSPQFSFAGSHTAYSLSDVEKDIEGMSWNTSIPKWAFDALRRGIAVHHAGMNKQYRSLVESLFRMGFLRVVIATGTLALGINAPTKTSVFCGDSPYLTALMYRQCAGRAGRRGYDLLGNVVFYGLAMDRVQRLILSKLPSLGGNFPLTSTLCLRLMNLLEGSNYADVATRAIQSMLKLPHVCFGSDTGRDQLLHHVRFSFDYLRRAGLLDPQGKPMNLFGIAAHLYYTEPGNFALVTLARNGVLHRICGQPSLTDAKRGLVLLLSHLFGRKLLPSTYTSESNLLAIQRHSPSMVLLPPLPRAARKVLVEHDREILHVFTGYALTFASQYKDQLGKDCRLPLSGQEFAGNTVDEHSFFRRHLQETRMSVVARSPFIANSGHEDQFKSVEELTRTARHGLHLSEHAIPSLGHITAVQGKGDDTFSLNAYLLDFYTHGQVAALAAANGIRRGDVWYLLQDFMLTLMTIRGGLEQLLLKASQEASVEEDEEEDAEGGDYDPSETDETGGGMNESDFKRPNGVTDLDWRVYEVVDGVTKEFNEKFKKMWA